MDPISLAVGGLLFAAGFLVGAITRRRGKDTETTKAVCGCGHGLDMHDREEKVCRGEQLRDRYVDGRHKGLEYVSCSCLRYVGPQLVEELFAPRHLPPAD